MRIIYTQQATQKALKNLDQRLHQLFGNPSSNINWDFPKPGGNSDTLATWSIPITNLKINKTKYNHLIIGLKPKFSWWWSNPHLRRCPFLLRLDDKPARNGITPTVEINIPRPMRRGANGCFATDQNDNVWLYHRGSRLTVNSNQRIPKEEIHQYFKNNFNKHLVFAEDNGSTNEFIPVVRLNSKNNKFKSDLIEFVKTVKALKATQ